MARDPWLDNVKMTLVTLVVVGHALTLMPGEAFDSQVYDFVYYWHIPAFVLVSGYLSRSFEWTRRHLTALVTTIAVPYLIFEGAISAFRIYVGQEDGIENVFIDPHWPMWYLAALFQWRLLTPILKRHWLAIPVTMAVSLVFGTGGSVVFDLNRTLGLLPFFTLGLHVGPRVLARLRTERARAVGLVALAVIFVIAGYTDDWIETGFLYYSDEYANFGVGPTEGIGIRLDLLAIATVGAFSIWAVCIRRASWFSRMGEATMVVYLFHGFFVRAAQYLGYQQWASEQGTWIIWPTIVAAILLSLFLAWHPVSSRLVWLADPINTWQRHRRPVSSAR